MKSMHVLWVPRGRDASDVYREIRVFGQLFDPPWQRFPAALFPRWARWQRLWGEWVTVLIDE